VILVLSGIECANSIELVEQHHIQQMIYRIGIVRMPLQDLRELLGRAVVVHVVEVLKGLGILRVGGAERELLRRMGYRRLGNLWLRNWRFSGRPGRRLLSPEKGRK